MVQPAIDSDENPDYQAEEEWDWFHGITSIFAIVTALSMG